MATVPQLVERYLLWLGQMNYSPRTVEARRCYLTAFADWVGELGLVSVDEVTEGVLDAYRRHVSQRKRWDGQPLSFRSQRNRLVPVKSFFRWLRQSRLIEVNPASDMPMPRMEKRLPRSVPAASSVERCLALANGKVKLPHFSGQYRAFGYVLFRIKRKGSMFKVQISEGSNFWLHISRLTLVVVACAAN